ncbi:MAG: ketopantoate reductase family protein [Spirochaetia bacterium]|nr:ketopantoate reductase family protein [Spirochaetia bacterium]
MKLCIYGTGSMGTVLGAFLARAGREVDLVDAYEEHVAALNRDGARVIGKVDFVAPVRAVSPAALGSGYDVVFLMTKQHENRKHASFLADRLAPGGVVCTMQNGLPERALAEVLGADRVAGCALGWGATFRGPGVSELTSEPGALTFHLGSEGVGEERLERIAEQLRDMGSVTIERNFIGARWSKLLINAALSGVSTALGCDFGSAVSTDRRRRVVHAVIKECIEVTRAGGIRVEPVQGTDIVRLFDYRGPVKRFVARSLIPFATRRHRALRASMLQDLEKGRPCEIDAINGAVRAEGLRLGVATPVNDRVVELVKSFEAGERKPGPENLALFDGLA